MTASGIYEPTDETDYSGNQSRPILLHKDRPIATHPGQIQHAAAGSEHNSNQCQSVILNVLGFSGLKVHKRFQYGGSCVRFSDDVLRSRHVASHKTLARRSLQPSSGCVGSFTRPARPPGHTPVALMREEVTLQDETERWRARQSSTRGRWSICSSFCITAPSGKRGRATAMGLGAVKLITGLTGFCPLNHLLGRNTYKPRTWLRSRGPAPA
jgi:hypothetical protein